jgi:hypothetical protein
MRNLAARFTISILLLVVFFGLTHAQTHAGEAFKYFSDRNFTVYENFDEFEPDKPVTKAELIKFIALIHANNPDKIDRCMQDEMKRNWRYIYFQDVLKEDWFAPYVCYAVETGQLNHQLLFHPEKEMSRYAGGQLILLILNPTSANRIGREELTALFSQSDSHNLKLFQPLKRSEAIQVLYERTSSVAVRGAVANDSADHPESDSETLSTESPDSIQPDRPAPGEKIVIRTEPGTGGGGGSRPRPSGGGGGVNPPNIPIESVCGNGIKESGEACDDGNTIREDCAYGLESCQVCDAQCQWTAGATSYCGDGVIHEQHSEQCDDHNRITENCEYGLTSCSVCGAECEHVSGSVSFCGDGVIDSLEGEECDGGPNCTDSCLLHTPDPITKVNQDVRQYVSHLKSKIIPRETEEYQIPTNAQISDFIHALSPVFYGQYTLAADRFEDIEYRLVQLTGDTSPYYVIEEISTDNKGDNERGWGSLIISPEHLGQSPLIIETPHTLYEPGSIETATEAFLYHDAAVYILPGAHRHANAALVDDRYHVSDVAHNPQSIFHQVTQAFLGPNTKVIQFHGFSTLKHSKTQNPRVDIILSHGSRDFVSELQQSIADQLKALGYRLENCGKDWTILCSTTNVQGKLINSSPDRFGDFIHVEMSEVVRQDESNHTRIGHVSY